MQEKMPRTPFSTGLSGSAKEAEIRIRNLFTGPKKHPPIPLMILMAAVCIFCGDLVSCQQRPKEPSLVMETQYYDSYANYLEIPMLALPAGEENEAVDAINAGLAQLGEEYEFLKTNLGVSEWCILYPSTTGRYINLVFYENVNSYGNDGYVRSWVYDKKEGVQVTEEDALALAGATREALCGGLEELIANDPEHPRGMYEPADIVGFRIKADGQPVFYLSAFVDYVELGSGGALDEWYCLYVWEGGEYTRYSCMVFGDSTQYPLVPAEETDKLDPPLWNQWYFAGEEPAGGFVDKSVLEPPDTPEPPDTSGPDASSPDSPDQDDQPAPDQGDGEPVPYDPEICLYRDGFSTPIGPGNWVESMFQEFEPEIIVQEGLDVYRPGDRWEEWVVDGGGDAGGISARRYYDSEADRWSFDRLETSRADMYTPRGIRVGATREEVLAAYPGLLSDEKEWNWYYPDDYLWYCSNESGLGPRLYFFFVDDVVYVIQMVDMFN